MKNYGLTTEQAVANKAKGSNELSQREGESFFDMLKDALFGDPCMRILLIALVVKLIFYVIGQMEATLIAISQMWIFKPIADELHQLATSVKWQTIGSNDWIDAVILAGAIVVVSFLGAYIAYRQDRGAQALQREASQIKVKVYRDGQLVELSINDVVYGDCVFLQAGDKIPADGILLDGFLKVDQAALNGESKEAEKQVLGERAIPGNDDLFTEYKCFRGSVVTSGSAIMLVTDVGDNTVLGDINKSLQEKDESKTPSEEKLEKLTKQISAFGYCGGATAGIINFVLGMMNMSHYTIGGTINLTLSIIMLGVSIVVMAVPEGLPLMNTLVQGLNVGKMMKAHIYVKNPKAIETAGYLTHVFTDKTGTLTNGRMTVANLVIGDATIHERPETISAKLLQEIVVGGGVNNDATISGEGKAIGSNDTDRALMTFFAVEHKLDVDKSLVITKEPFDSKVKYAAITLQDGSRYLKGAPDIIMQGCTSYLDADGNQQPMTEETHQKLVKAWNGQTERAMRVIAIVKECNGEKIFVTLVSIRDDVRKDVKASIQKMHRAGVNVTMVTGDVLTTAKAIAKEAGLINSSSDICITHEELAKMSDGELMKALPNLKVVARAVPSDKERLVAVSRSIGEVVGMTGDGVNDASALHKADVGFAMGSGTEVAKEAGDIIILNDSLTSIADAIMYGRTMSKSVKKFIIFQLTVNVSTVFTAVLGPILGWAEVFTIVQILWINMIMDTLAAIAFGQEPARDSYMEEAPVPRTAEILNGYLKSSILVGGIFITVICLGILKNIFGVYNLIGSTDMNVVRTFMFATFIMAIIWNSLNARTESMNLFEHIAENRNFIFVMTAVTVIQVIIIQVGGKVFGTMPLTLGNWGAVVAIAFLIIPIDLVRKAVVKQRGIKE